MDIWKNTREKIQYSVQYKNANGKGFRSGKDNESV